VIGMIHGIGDITTVTTRQAQEILWKADAEATAIYARSYNQSPESGEFYYFLKSMETYENTLQGDDWLVLSTDNEFFRFLEGSSGK
jgi:membrane protease subunit HflC